MKSTFSRNFFPAAIILLAALLLVGTSFRALMRNYLEDSAMEALENDASTISTLAQAYYLDESLTKRDFLINLTVSAQVSGADAVICNNSGELVLCSDAPFGCEHQGMTVSEDYLQRVFTDGIARDSGFIGQLYSEARYIVSMPIYDAATGLPVGLVMVSSPTASTMQVLKRVTDIYLFVSLLVVAIAVVAMTIFARRQAKPLQQMAKAANAFGHGNLSARVQLEGSHTREMEELALAFNNMASSLEKSEYQRQEFVANVSHELKTPMTTIGGYVDGMLDGTSPPERQRHYMQLVSDETKRLSRLVRSMLDISRLDQNGIPEEQKSRFDLTECLGQVLITFEQKINNKKLDVQVDMPEHPVYTRANQDYITQVVYNLVDNAVKFCPQGGKLGLTLKESSTKVYISVANDGDTIPPEELPLVFDRFHKLDKSRSMNRDGWGLGLYIVKTIICRHGEDISVTSRDGRTEFTFTLPLVN